jgi:hypothetical protein
MLLMKGKDGRVRWYGHGHERKQTGARMVESLGCWFGWFAVVVWWSVASVCGGVSGRSGLKGGPFVMEWKHGRKKEAVGEKSGGEEEEEDGERVRALHGRWKVVE